MRRVLLRKNMMLLIKKIIVYSVPQSRFQRLIIHLVMQQKSLKHIFTASMEILKASQIGVSNYARTIYFIPFI